LHLQIKIILNWLMDARSSKQSAAAQLTNGPVVRTATWRNRMSLDKHCFEPYTHFVVRVTLIPGPVVNDITGAAPLDQGSALGSIRPRAVTVKLTLPILIPGS
jgi:hypothetical protein